MITMKQKVIFGFTFTILIGMLIGFFLGTAVTVIPKDVLTQNRFFVIERDIRSYYKNTGRLPKTLDDLKIAYGKNNSSYDMDAWGKQLKYNVGTNGFVVLSSDGKPIRKNVSYTLTQTFNPKELE